MYKISYQDCEATYVDQTKPQLKTRIQEHSADIKKKNGLPSSPTTVSMITIVVGPLMEATDFFGIWSG